MRTGFHNDLEWLEERAEEALGMARDALETVLAAVAESSEPLADAVIEGDDRIDNINHLIQSETLGIIARQAPVASDLRLLTGLGYMATHIERMGDCSVNIAKLVKLAGPVAYSPDIVRRLVAMGNALLLMIDQASRAFAARDVELARNLAERDDPIDEANRLIFQVAVGPEIPTEARPWAGYMLLCGRALERLGDHIVDLGEQIAFIVTGEFEEFTDASHAVLRDE